MKRIETDKINNLVFNYLSLMGLSNDEKISIDNPISNYFYKNIYRENGDFNFVKKNEKTKISYKTFYDIISESYRMYKKINDVIKNQDVKYREIVMNIIGDDDIDYYIDRIVTQYKDSFFEIVKSYKTKNNKFINIKIDILTDRMIYYGSIEEYDRAIELQNTIKKLKKED